MKMNKRKFKKKEKYLDLLVANFAESYRDARLLDRQYKEYCNSEKKRVKKMIVNNEVLFF